MFGIGLAVLIRGKQNYVINPPQGGVISNSLRIMLISAKHGFDLDMAKPSQQLSVHQNCAWDDAFVNELKDTLVACKAFLFFPIYWVTFSQMLNNFVSQGEWKFPALLIPSYRLIEHL